MRRGRLRQRFGVNSKTEIGPENLLDDLSPDVRCLAWGGKARQPVLLCLRWRYDARKPDHGTGEPA